MLLSNQIFELEQQVEGVEVIVGVAKVARGNIQHISYIPQTEQLSLPRFTLWAHAAPFGYSLYSDQSIIFKSTTHSIPSSPVSSDSDLFSCLCILGKLEHHTVMMRWYHNLYNTPCT